MQLLEKEDSGCHILLRDDKVDDLSRMYRLFCSIPKGLEPVAAIFKRHVMDMGIALVKEADDAARNKKVEDIVVGVEEHGVVWKLLELHEKYLQYVRECFGDHFLFQRSLKEAFEVFCNKKVAGSTSEDMLASFCDDLLKKGGGNTMSNDAIEDTFEKVVKLLTHISDKDLFVELYRKKQARRLLYNNSANEDHERSIVMKLKQRYGGQLTSKIVGMITDLTLTRENQLNFEEYLMRNPKSRLGINLTVSVLTSVFWPNYKTLDLILPREMAKCVEEFKRFYETKTKHRKLTWIYSLGTCNVIGNFDAKPIELIITTYQAAILLLFNAKERLSYNDIKNEVNLTDEDVVRLLHSLSCTKYKILHKNPNTKTVGQDDSFKFNTKFTDKMRRIKIPLLIVEEKKKVKEEVEEDRRHTIDAAIVQIMKSRKELLLHQLVAECVKLLSQMFKPHLKMIKMRIENLISREYLERDGDNQNLFNYLA